MQKEISEITKVTLDGATYYGESFIPAKINFLYGGNGTGKTTIANHFRNQCGLTWRTGCSPAEYSVHVFDQNYIDANITHYHGLDAVFTVNEINSAVVRKVDELTAQKAAADRAREAAVISRNHLELEIQQKYAQFEQYCWSRTTNERKALAAALTGYKMKRYFAEWMLETTVGHAYDLEELKQAVSVAFRKDPVRYPEFANVSDVRCLDDLPGLEILAQPVTSRSETDFARFVRALNATSWVREGHTRYRNADCRCPYCQQVLPENFEEEIRACFDEQYRNDLEKLEACYNDYRNAANSMYMPLASLPKEICSEVDPSGLREKLSLLKKVIAANLQKIADKKSNPEMIVEPKETAGYLQNITDLVNGINRTIRAINTITDNRSLEQKKLRDKAGQYFADLLAEVIRQYRQDITGLEKKIKEMEAETVRLEKISAECTRQINEENRKSVDTRSTVDRINAMLNEAGYRGFELRDRTDIANTYELIRPENGQTAQNLSEGERNFIAFLYFYQQVRGMDINDGAAKKKIVVIDDPVSGMDSHSLSFVASLVREMTENCRNSSSGEGMRSGEADIQQLFVLTHNAQFFRETAEHYVSWYTEVSYFLLRKVNNQSTVRICEKNRPGAADEKVNCSPVVSNYAALWEEYREARSSSVLISVVRRILEYYFIQLCGYDNESLTQIVLRENRSAFGVLKEYESAGDVPFQLAEEILSGIGMRGRGMDWICVDQNVDLNMIRCVFRKIFEVTHQEMHYRRMTR